MLPHVRNAGKDFFVPRETLQQRRFARFRWRTASPSLRSKSELHSLVWRKRFQLCRPWWWRNANGNCWVERWQRFLFILIGTLFCDLTCFLDQWNEVLTLSAFYILRMRMPVLCLFQPWKTPTIKRWNHIKVVLTDSLFVSFSKPPHVQY